MLMQAALHEMPVPDLMTHMRTGTLMSATKGASPHVLRSE